MTIWVFGDQPSPQDRRSHPLPHPHPARQARACDSLTGRRFDPKKIKRPSSLQPEQGFFFVGFKMTSSVVLSTFRCSASRSPPRSLQASWKPGMPSTYYVLRRDRDVNGEGSIRALEQIIPRPPGLLRCREPFELATLPLQKDRVDWLIRYREPFKLDHRPILQERKECIRLG